MRERRAWELAALGVILLAAGWLRLRQLGLMEFKGDEALAVRIGRDILHGDIRTTGLTSSVGAANPPLFVYLTALPLAFWNDPRGATGFVGLLAVVAVGLTYAVLRPRFGWLAALTASALLATAPWAVLYGRKLWAQDLLPVVTISLLWSLFVLLERRRTALVLFVPLFFSFTVELNFSALALAVPVVLALLYRWRDVHWRAFLGGVVVALVPLGPWLAHNARHHFTDVVTLAEEGRGHGGFGEGVVEAVRQTVHLVSAGGWRFVTGPAHESGAAWTLGRAAGAAAAIALGLGLVTSVVAIVRGARGGHSPSQLDAARRALLVVWLVGIWLSYLTSEKARVAPHYLIVSYPITYALAGIGLADVVRLLPRPGRRAAQMVAAIGVTAVAAAFVAFSLSFQRYVDRQGGTGGDYGVAYEHSVALAAAARTAHLDVDDQALEFLATGSLDAPAGTKRLVTTQNLLEKPKPLPCTGSLRRFGPLEGCFPARTLSAALPGTASPRDRAAWRALLHWPASCESAWHATGLPTAGVDLYPGPAASRLVAVECAPGAYQADALLYLVAYDATPTGPLVLQIYIDPGTGRPKLTKRSVILGVLGFTKIGVLTVFDKARGVGDCGIYTRYRLEGTSLVLVEARAKTACDGKPPYDPTRWPRLPVPKHA